MNGQPISEEKALQRMARICSMREYAAGDISEKLRRMRLEEDAIARIIKKLVSNKYIDDERFARSFVSDKLRFNKWGKVKIEFALRQKRISQEIIDTVFSEFDRESLSASLKRLLTDKAKSVKGASEYEKNTKLIRFALNRGFSMDDTLKCLKEINGNNDFE